MNYRQSRRKTATQSYKGLPTSGGRQLRPRHTPYESRAFLHFDIRYEIMDYISIAETADKWGITRRRVQVLCAQNRIPGLTKFGKAWAIPRDAEKPADARKQKSVK